MALRTMLIRTHMQDLKDVTNNVHYENFRFKKLAYVTGDKAKPNNKYVNIIIKFKMLSEMNNQFE
jgi:septin 7